jgi:hypothetical protein
MSNCVDFNYPNFNTAARRLRAVGWEIENPAECTPPTCSTWEGYMRLALQKLLTCESVIALPGWEKSRGAAVEMYLARQLGMQVYMGDPQLDDLQPIRTDSLGWWLSQVLDGIASPGFIRWLQT